MLDVKDLRFVGVVCAECGTEVTFDLDKSQHDRAVQCPNCKTLILEMKSHPVEYQYNLVSLLRDIYRMDHTHRIRFHVTRPEQKSGA